MVDNLQFRESLIVYKARHFCFNGILLYYFSVIV